jgi:hypothetical protein
MARTFCKVAGLLFLVIGVAGFLDPNLLGMHLTTTHNAVHILSGLLSLYFGFVAGSARAFCTAFGFVYLGLGVLGFVAPGVVAALLGHAGPVDAGMLTPDNLVHGVLGVAFLAAGLVRDTSVGYGDRARHPAR